MTDHQSVLPDGAHACAEYDAVDRARAAVRAALVAHARGCALLAQSETLADAAGRLRQASGVLREQQQAEQRTQLRASIAGYVGRLRAAGAPPERMLVLVKAAVHEGAGSAAAPASARALMADVVRWSIAAYYGAD